MHYTAYTALLFTVASTTQQENSNFSLHGIEAPDVRGSSIENAEFCAQGQEVIEKHPERRTRIHNHLRQSNSVDLFSFLRSSFQQKALQFVQDNPILLEYFPVGIRKTIETAFNSGCDSNPQSFGEMLEDTYRDWMTYLPDLSRNSQIKTGQDTNHIGAEDRVHDATLSTALCSKDKLTPILFVPGLLGSALEERRSNATGLPAECTISSLPGEWNRSWVSIASFLGYRCWREVLKLSLEASVDRSDNFEVKKKSSAEWNTGFFASVLQNFVLGLIDLFAPKASSAEQDDPWRETHSKSSGLEMQQAESYHEGFSHHLMKAKFPDGIEVRPVTDGIEATRCLDASNRWTCHTTSYFKDLLDYMTRNIANGPSKKGGFTVKPGETSQHCPQYVLRQNIEVIPFDFRLGGYELYHAMDSQSAQKSGEFGGFFNKLKRKIEDLYRLNDSERVAVVTHSLGGPLTVAFLNTYVNEKWKAKYLKKVITIAAPFGGAVKAVQAALLGETESLLVPAWSTQSMLSSWPGIYMVFPNTPNSDGEKSPNLVEVDEAHDDTITSPSLLSGWFTGVSNYFSTTRTTESNEHNKASKRLKYAAQELPEVLRAHPNVPNVYATYLERLRPLFDAFRVPPKGVDIDCIYSTGIKTTKKLIYRTFHEKDVFTPHIETDDEGDGTVRTESLGLCRSWKTDANIDVNIGTEYVDIFGKLPKNLARKQRGSIRRTIKLEGVNHVDIISNTPEVWDFILQSVNAG